MKLLFLLFFACSVPAIAQQVSVAEDSVEVVPYKREKLSPMINLIDWGPDMHNTKKPVVAIQQMLFDDLPAKDQKVIIQLMREWADKQEKKLPAKKK